MRFDTPVYFQTITAGAYDRGTGNYGSDTIDEVKRYADVNDTAAETMRLVYGGLKQGSLTIRLQTHYNAPFDRIRVGNKVYSVSESRELREKATYIVSEVQCEAPAKVGYAKVGYAKVGYVKWA